MNMGNSSPLPRHASCRPGYRPVSRESRRVRALVALFTLCVVIPVLDVPGWGVSLSTPLFCFLAIEVVFGSKRPNLRPYTKWILLAALFWTGQFLSIAGNAFAGRLNEVTWLDSVHLVRLAYWMTVFVVTTVVVSRFDLGPWLCRLLAFCITGLSALRLIEAFGLDTWGYAKALLYTPNGYGWIFSTFTPFLAWLALTEKGWRRLLLSGGLAAALLAIAGNGSRSSWIAVSAGLLLLVVFFFATQPRPGRRLAALAPTAAVLATLAAAFIPRAVWTPVMDRLSTLQQLQRDKPLAIRLLMLQKASSLFGENPAFGIGTGRFRHSNAALEIPALLRYKNEQNLNGRSAHNAYAALLAESGVVGCAPLAALLLILTWRGWCCVWRGARQGMGWTVPAYIAFITMSLHLWTLSGLTGTAPWFVYGLVAGVIERDSRKAGVAPRDEVHRGAAGERA